MNQLMDTLKFACLRRESAGTICPDVLYRFFLKNTFYYSSGLLDELSVTCWAVPPCESHSGDDWVDTKQFLLSCSLPALLRARRQDSQPSAPGDTKANKPSHIE